MFPLVADSLFVKQCATEDGLRALEEMAESIRVSFFVEKEGNLVRVNSFSILYPVWLEINSG